MDVSWCTWEGVSAFFSSRLPAWVMSDDTWKATKEFFNSAFFTSALGALAGAWAGAIAAQKITLKDKRKAELSTKIQDTNVALAIGFSIINTLMALKKQHVRDLVKQHADDRKRLEEFEAKRKANPGGSEVFSFKADLRTLGLVTLPLVELNQIILTRLSLSNRAMTLAMQLVGSFDSLNGAIQLRNELIDGFRLDQFPEGAKLEHLYFGLPFAGGHVDEKYPAVLYGLGRYLDDMIFFTKLVCDDLAEYGNDLVNSYKKDVGKDAPRLSQLDFETPEAKPLLPDPADYASVLNAFQKRTPEPKTRWERLSAMVFFRRSDKREAGHLPQAVPSTRDGVRSSGSDIECASAASVLDRKT